MGMKRRPPRAVWPSSTAGEIVTRSSKANSTRGMASAGGGAPTGDGSAITDNGKRTIVKKRSFIANLLVCSTLVWAASPASAARGRCAAPAKLEFPGHVIAIREVREIAPTPAGVTPELPAHCRIDGIIDARTGPDGKNYGVGFAVALPLQWNGRFLFQGGGGLNGSVASPLGAAYAGDRSALVRGF